MSLDDYEVEYKYFWKAHDKSQKSTSRKFKIRIFLFHAVPYCEVSKFWNRLLKIEENLNLLTALTKKMEGLKELEDFVIRTEANKLQKPGSPRKMTKLMRYTTLIC